MPDTSNNNLEEYFQSIISKQLSPAMLTHEMIVYYQKQMAGTANKDKITNFNEGSVARILLDTVAMDSYKLWYLLDQASRNCFAQTANNDFLSLIGEEHGIHRYSATVSHGVVNATRASELNKDQEIIIPAGTQLITAKGDLIFTTDVDLLIPTDDVGSVQVNATSVKPGMMNNIKNGTVLVAMNGKSDVNYIVGESFHDGKDIETDEALRDRIRGAVYLKVGTDSFYKQKPLVLPDVKGVSVATDSTTKDINITVYPASTKPAVEELLLMDENKVAGTKIVVTGGDVEKINVTIEDVSVMNNANKATVIDVITEKIKNVFKDLKPHLNDNSVYESTLYLENLHKAISTTENIQDYKLTEPIAKQTCPIHKLLDLGVLTIT
jgi:uncharacterized phage protein gp47/JayE